jgi:hypothetical protein
LLFVSRFPAVGDFGQELAEVLNLLLGPNVMDYLAGFQNPRSGHLSSRDIATQGLGSDPELPGGLGCRIQFHLDLNVTDRYLHVKENCSPQSGIIEPRA